ncbi:Xylose operon regulatory protein [Pirellulimonas nuda]|uniref:Xylose operon regulatory protein n=1 Tax=Pirellulimonas nuda TaxID=2528009 RepID=A0A518DBI7_9BACT|nr:DNA-binding transcriptional regulator [Pirellulimonas nuda]QDU88830.1 Xylose operon regulatory protein [Pirellulimonas nuda]
MAKLKHVLLLIESSRAYGRDCLLGVADYLRAHGGWHVLNIERGLSEQLPKAIARWKGDGVLARIENARIAAAIQAFGVPTVDLRGSYPPPGGAIFDSDHAAIGQMAAEHFLDVGFTKLAFCGFPGVGFSEQRGAAFCEHLSARDIKTHVYEPQNQRLMPTDVLGWEARGEFEGATIASWLKGLPRPLAVFACNDIRGRQVIEACHQFGIAVPDEVAVVGVDDDEVICELSSPPLSSIRPNAQKLGFEGAAMLDGLMRGKKPPAAPILVPPAGISRRLSSDALAIKDTDVAAAIRFIREHACEGIGVPTLLQKLPLSRSSLERRFKVAVGRTPTAEIERVRMERAKLLLAETNNSLKNVARLTGYGTASQFATAFKRYAEMTPGQFRERNGRQSD